MTADPIQAAKERLSELCASDRFDPSKEYGTAYDARQIARLHKFIELVPVLLAELSRLEGENERLQADNDVRSSCLRDTQLALAEARRQIAERDEALLSAAKYLVRMENALLKDDLDMKLDFPGEEGPSAFATTLVPDFDVVAYEVELFAGRAPPPTGGAGMTIGQGEGASQGSDNDQCGEQPEPSVDATAALACVRQLLGRAVAQPRVESMRYVLGEAITAFDAAIAAPSTNGGEA